MPAPVFLVEEGYAAPGAATVYGQADAGAEEAEPIVGGKARAPAGGGLPAASGGPGRCVRPLLGLLVVMTGAMLAKELLPSQQAGADRASAEERMKQLLAQASADTARGFEKQVADLEAKWASTEETMKQLLEQASADTAKGLEAQMSEVEAKRAGTEETMKQLLAQASADKARGFEKQVVVLEDTITQLRAQAAAYRARGLEKRVADLEAQKASNEETIKKLRAQPGAQKAAAGATGRARAHPPRVSPFLRYARYDCQDKGSMLAGYPGPTVLEIGAFDGDEWKQFKGVAKKLWSVEPSPDKKVPLGLLRERYAQQGFPVEFFPLAVTQKTGEVKFWVQGSGSQSQMNTAGRPPPWVNQSEFDKRAVSVPASRLDDLWKNQLGRQHITMLKIDTQGHEPGVIMSGNELFASDPPEIVHMEYSPGLMKAAGFDGVQLLLFLYSFGYLCFDCAMFGPPPIANREFRDFNAHFARLLVNGGEHGQWADIVCLL